MKRIAFLLLVLLLLVPALPKTALAIGNCGTASTDLPQTNVSADNVYGRTARQYCFIEPRSNGNFMTVYYVEKQNRVEVSYYSSTFKILKTLSIDPELPIWGGFYSSGDHYYLFTGQENKQESAEVEVIRVIKYTKDWKRVGSVGLYDVNISKPFAFGQVRCAMADNVLAVHTSRHIYKDSGGVTHQTNFSFSINIDSMSLIDCRAGITSGNGYVSHSFDQYIEYDGEKFVTMDHGDAYPRAVVLNELYPASFKYPGKISSQKSVNFFSMPGELGDNDTGLYTGGFAMNDNCYVMVGNQRWDDLNNPQRRTLGPYNVFVSVIDKKTYKNTRYALSNVTEKPKVDQWGFVSGKQAYTPYLVKLNDSSFLVMWRITEEDTFSYQKLDANGKPVGKVYTAKGTLSYVQPKIINGKVTWYSNVHNSVTFYTISTSDLSSFSSKKVVNIHDYAAYGDSKYHWFKCRDCGHTTAKAAHKNTTAVFSDDGFLQTKCKDCSRILKSDPIKVTATEFTSDSGAFGLKFTAVTKSGINLAKDISLSRISLAQNYVDGKVVPIQITYKFTYKGAGGGSFTRTFYRLNGMTSIAPIEAQGYTGKAIKPAVKITKGSTTLKSGKDYTVSYKNNVKIGTATVTIKGEGDFFGTATQTFKIVKNIAKAKVSGISNKTYNGSLITQTPKVVLGGKTLKNGTDYTLSYKNNVKVGTATVTITGKGSYKGTIKKTFKITAQKATKLKVSLSAATFTYNGKVKAPTVTVKNTAGKVLKKGTDYTVTYSGGRKNVGTYKVTVKFKGNYSGTRTATFKITPVKVEKCKISLSAYSFTYNGKVKTPAVIVKDAAGKTLKKGTHYTVTYSVGRKSVGEYKVTVKMKGNYSGSRVLTFNVLPK